MKTCPVCKTELPPDQGRSKGGQTRWKGTTKADRSEALSKAAQARWSRRNGTAPVKPGSKPRGRPRKANPEFSDSQSSEQR